MNRYLMGFAAALFLALPAWASELDGEFAAKSSMQGGVGSYALPASLLVAKTSPTMNHDLVALAKDAKGSELDRDTPTQTSRWGGGRGWGGSWGRGYGGWGRSYGWGGYGRGYYGGYGRGWYGGYGRGYYAGYGRGWYGGYYGRGWGGYGGWYGGYGGWGGYGGYGGYCGYGYGGYCGYPCYSYGCSYGYPCYGGYYW